MKNNITYSTLGILYNLYLDSSLNTSKNATSKFKSAVVKYLVPALGGEPPLNLRATTQDVDYAIAFLEGIESSQIVICNDKLIQYFSYLEISQKTKKDIKSTINKFINFGLEKLDIRENDKPENAGLLYGLKPYNRPGEGARERITHGRKIKSTYALGAKCFKDDYINKILQKELKEYEKFCLTTLDHSPKNTEREVQKVLQIFGWLHRFKNIPLEELRFDKIARLALVDVEEKEKEKYYKSLEEAMSKNEDINLLEYKDILIKQQIQKDIATIKARQDIKLIDEYLDFTGNHPASKQRSALIYLSIIRFIYRNEVDGIYKGNYDKFPIHQLVKHRVELWSGRRSDASESIPYSDKSVPWLEALKVLEKLRKCAETEFYLYKDYKTEKSTYKSKKRPNTYVNDYQKFITLGLMTLAPPNRSQIYYSLEIGKTLLCGNYTAGKFISKQGMSNPSDAKYYYYSGDFKTVKMYKEFWCEIPNIEFSDGKKFYDYLDNWINNVRESVYKLEHNYLLFGCKKLTPLTATDLKERIKHIFSLYTKTPVTPKEFRRMYVTFLNEQNVEVDILDSAAISMLHTKRTQEQIYDQQSRFEKTRSITNFNKKFYDKFFKSP